MHVFYFKMECYVAKETGRSLLIMSYCFWNVKAFMDVGFLASAKVILACFTKFHKFMIQQSRHKICCQEK